MKTFLKVLKWTGIVLVIFIIGVYLFVQLTWDNKLDAPYPGLKASTDTAVIARGEYLVYGPAHCAACHMPMDKFTEVEAGSKIPLSGGWEESLPGLGTFRAPNLTPDMETGIGKLSDAELARSMRYMVNPDGRVMVPFMNSQGMSDEDLTAVISFLRSQPAVNNKIEPSHFAFLAKALITFGLMRAEGPKTTPPVSVPMDTTIAYGNYLANHIASCRGCHTEMDLNNGQYIGPEFAGKGLFPANHFSEGYSFVSPNLTPDPGTGVMAIWSEDAFVARFRAGRVHKGLMPMPWAFYSRMHENDLKAIYRYLQSLTPVENKVEKTIYGPGEELPKPE